MKQIYFDDITEDQIKECNLELNKTDLKEAAYFLGPKPMGASISKIDNGYLTIIDKDTNEFVGIMSGEDQGHRTVSHALYIFEKYRKKGYGAAAIIKYLDQQFGYTEAVKSRICIYDGNEPSRLLHQKLGYSVEAVLRDYLRVNGKLNGLMYLVVKPKDFKAASKKYKEMQAMEEENKALALTRNKKRKDLAKFIKENKITKHDIERVMKDE